MKTFKKISDEIRDTHELGQMVQVYEEVAASKMQKIRGDIMVARDFFDGLMKISEEVGVDLENLKLDKPKKEAVVLVSANAGLYGEIIGKTFNDFIAYISKPNIEIFIVGRLGKEMLEKAKPGTAFQMIELSDEKIEDDKFSVLAQKLMGFEAITVFYGRFKSIVNQLSHTSTISGEIIKDFQKGDIDKMEKKRLKYFYEPDVINISEFFGNEILVTTFGAMLRESQLAKFGSRLMHLDMATHKIEEKLMMQAVEKRKIRKRIMEKKQKQSLGGILFR
jgi:F0F1-type ATP synthase gamma subunit